MIKRILDSRFPLIVYNPPMVFDKNYFIRCHEAGALPVYDTEFISNDRIISTIDVLSKEDILFGIRILDSNTEIKEYVTVRNIVNLDLIVFKYDDANDLKNFTFPNKDYKVFIETRHIDINEDLEAIAPHGLILKGNEAPGAVSKFTSMILMQYYLEKSSLPVFVHGGVGMHTAPGLFAAGVNGIVLDNQLYLTDEAPLSQNFKEVLGNIKEGDSAVIGDTLNRRYRVFAKLGTKIVNDLKNEESFLKGSADADENIYRKITENFVLMTNPEANAIQSLFYLGQDSIFAIHFVKKSKKLKDVIYSLFQNVANSLNSMDEHDPLVANSKMAREHNTKYPVVLGPMANINDNPEFAHEVYGKGGLPFFAMGNLPVNLAEKIISDGKNKFSNFGAGLIGTPEINKSFEGHLELLKKYKVPFALIAVGIPLHVNSLEAEGIKTYLHTPALQMLENAIKNSCRRFIFEGTEAGGHIGNLTSFVLWEISIEKLINQTAEVIGMQSVLFAGGIASKSGSFFISGMSVMLAKLGAKIGIQAGSPYLFTEEIVRTGALKELYQKLLIERNETTVIGSTVGLSTRTIISPFSLRMIEKEHQMIKEKVPLAERKLYFEGNNAGSLLIAAKAFSPDFEKLKNKGELSYLYFNEDEHYDKGNFHTGASIAFFEKQITIKDIHDSFFEMKKNLSGNLNRLEIFSSGNNQINDEIAVIGMSCLYPDAGNLDTFWENIITKKYSIKEAPRERFDSDLYFSADRDEDGKSYSNLAGFVDYYEFDFEKYGYKETEARHLSRSQKMILDTAMMAIDNAGYLKNKKLPGDKTSVIIGSCLGNEYGDDLFLAMYYPEIRYHLDTIDEFNSLSEDEREDILEILRKGLKNEYRPKFPDGAALNVEASRIAKHLNLEGVNYTIDAACATSLAALDNAQKELLSGSSDVVIVGGVHTNLSPEVFVGFSKMGALSDEGSFPFDNRASGFVLGEGAGAFVLKRVKDAVRDNDTILGVIKGIGSSSDGKGKAIAAPKTEGQGYSIIRAFENSKTPVSFDDIGFIEAHGTATLIGDTTEIKTLMNTYKSSTPKGVSSIKSQIGHLLGGAGAAGLIKTLLAIKNKTLPPNGCYENPSARFSLEKSPFYIIRDAKEWVVPDGKPRMAAVSSFGFGGINYHVIVSEFTKSYAPVERRIFPDLDYNFNDDRIVVIGIGIVAPGSRNREQFWNNLQSGKNLISDIPGSRFHIDYYADEKDPLLSIPRIKAGIVNDYKFNNLNYKIPPATAVSIDRTQCFALDAASDAIEQAGIKDKFVNGNRVGVIIGTSCGENYNEQILRVRIPFIKKILSHARGIEKNTLNKIISGLEDSLKKRYYRSTEDSIPGLLSNVVSGRIANYFNCNGPNYIIEAECASSAVSLSVGVKDLLNKNVDFVITGGADANLTPANLMGFQLLKILSPDMSRVFDKRSKGLVMSEGAALMVITRYNKAREGGIDILGEIKDITFNSYGAENFIAPTTAGFTRVIDKFYQNSPYAKQQVDYIDVFASTHVVVDTWEKQALEKCFRHNLLFGNIKPEMGYFRTANPAMVLSKLILMGYHKKILPNFSYSREDSIVRDNSILAGSRETIDLNKRDSIYLAVNFSGLGGIHGHTVVRTMPGRFSRGKEQARYAAGEKAVSAVPAVRGGMVCALLSGQGAQYSGMMKELYDRHNDIKRIMDRGESLFMKARNYSLLELIFGQDARINLTENTQPSIFLSTAAIYSHLKTLGFNPHFFIGHSVGEFAALYCCGILGFDDAMNLIMKRSEFMKEAAESEKGSIMVVFTGPEDTVRLMRESGLKNIYLANKNSETQTAVSGGEKEIDDFCAYLNSSKISFMKLNLSGAFHSPLFRTASENLKEYLKGLNFNRADFSKIISNVTGDSYPDNPDGIKDLLVKQLVSPVEFIGSVKKLSAMGVTEFIEIGPNKILTNLLKSISIKNYTAVPSVDPKKGEAASYQVLIDYLTGKGSIPGPKKAAEKTVAATGIDTSSVMMMIKEIISDHTGYTLDMLESGLDLEADLGIDTVKLAEIFGKITSHYNLDVPADLKLSELNTIHNIAAYIEVRVKSVLSPATVEAQEDAGSDTGSVMKKLRAIISDHTGYTLDMLEAGLDLEADLGIDTVKQVEILGKISSHYSLDVPVDLRLSELNTIHKIASYIAEKTGKTGLINENSSTNKQNRAPAKEIKEPESIMRYVLGTVKAGLPDRANEKNIFSGKTILISGDDYGFSKKIVQIIKQKNGMVKTIGEGNAFDIPCSLHDLKSVKEAVEGLVKRGERIDGFIHLYPLNSYFSGREIDENEINASIKSFYVIIRTLYKELNRKGSLISILSFDSIIFPYIGRKVNINPVFSGISGMMKTINREMTGVIVKAVDFNFAEPLKNMDAIVDKYMNELMSRDMRVETGYDDSNKYILTLSQRSATRDADLIAPGDRILVSGGARGITYEIISEVARQNKGIKFVLCGRSDITKIDPQFLAEGIDEKFILNVLKERMKGAKPLEVKKAASNIMNLRKTRANLESLISNGVEADYHAVDVSNLAALKEVVKKYDRIDGVLHAAGVENSSMIEKKDLKDFSLVFDTKITGIMNILEALKNRDVKYFIGFSSVSAKFGNIGQVDYASANDMLGKFLQREKQMNPDIRIKVFNWTAWKDVGMATNESVKKVLLESGIELLPVEKGVRFFMEDLHDSTSDEVVITNFLPSFDRDGMFTAPPEMGAGEDMPFIGDTLDIAVYRRVLDPEKDLYLMHHVFDRVPLFLGATGIETMAEASASMAKRGARLWELTDFSIPYGIKILQGRPKEILIRSERDKSNPFKFNCSIISQFRNKMGVEMGEKIQHYTGTYLFADSEIESRKIEIPKFSAVTFTGNFDELIYHPRRLFMDGFFKTIDGVLSFDNRTLITRFHNRSDCRYFSNINNPKLVTDAIIIDGMFQTGGLFEFLSSSDVQLPSRIRRMNFFRDVVATDEYICITEKTGSTDKTNNYQITLADKDGNIFMKVEDYEMIKVGKMAPEDRIIDKFKF